MNVLRWLLIFLGFGLMVLWIIGNSSNAVNSPVNWLDLTAAVLSWIAGASTTPRTSRLGVGISCLALFLGLLAICLLSLLRGGTAWQTWASLGFGLAYGGLGLGLIRHPPDPRFF